MTLAELQAYVGAPSTRGAVYFAQRGDKHITAWQGAIASEDGWWFAITRPQSHPVREAIIAMGWCAGEIRDRDAEIKRRVSLACTLASQPGELEAAS